MKTSKPRPADYWRKKLEKEQPIQIEEAPEPWKKNPGDKTMLIAKPIEIDEMIRKVPRGKVITITEVRDALSEKHGTDITCPLTTGIFARIAAEAAEEDMRERGKSMNTITPWWRLLKADGRLNEKFPGGGEEQAKRLKAEGFTLIPHKGKKQPMVADWDKFLAY